MNKLVSKNPVLRFKLGKLIRKFGVGGPWDNDNPNSLLNLNAARRYVSSGLDGLYLWRWNKNGKWYVSPDVIRKNGEVSSKTVEEITPEKIVQLKNGKFIAKVNGRWYNENGLLITKFASPKATVGNSESSIMDRMLQDSTDRMLEASANPVLENQGNFESNGRSKYWNNQYQTFLNGLTPEQKQWLSADNVDYSNVRALLSFLGTNDDGKWGNNSRTAWELYLAKKSTATPTVNSSSRGMTYAEYELMINQKPMLAINPVINNALKNTIPWNRSQTRDIIRKAGYGAYENFSGAQRKALRQYLNGELYNKSLLQGYDLSKFDKFKLKIGGRLVSKNPIERFKQGKKLPKFQQGTGEEGVLFKENLEPPTYGVLGELKRNVKSGILGLERMTRMPRRVVATAFGAKYLPKVLTSNPVKKVGKAVATGYINATGPVGTIGAMYAPIAATGLDNAMLYSIYTGGNTDKGLSNWTKENIITPTKNGALSYWNWMTGIEK